MAKVGMIEGVTDSEGVMMVELLAEHAKDVLVAVPF
jgi:putative intracellular protease/amidase